MASPFRRPPLHDDLGLGLQAGPGRGVNKDGSFNVRRLGLPRFRAYDLYHHLITMGWGPFLGLLFLAFLASSAAALESLLGLLSFALATGLLYGRFSRPQACLRFSTSAVVAPYRQITGFMFRLVNMRSNQLIEVEATVSLSFEDPGSGMRRYTLLPLERSKIHLFPSNWTVVHPISEGSPLHTHSRSIVKESTTEAQSMGTR